VTFRCRRWRTRATKLSCCSRSETKRCWRGSSRDHRLWVLSVDPPPLVTKNSTELQAAFRVPVSGEADRPRGFRRSDDSARSRLRRLRAIPNSTRCAPSFVERSPQRRTARSPVHCSVAGAHLRIPARAASKRHRRTVELPATCGCPGDPRPPSGLRRQDPLACPFETQSCGVKAKVCTVCVPYELPIHSHPNPGWARYSVEKPGLEWDAMG